MADRSEMTRAEIEGLIGQAAEFVREQRNPGGHHLAADLVDALATALRAMLAREEWQPIETAPRDGSSFLGAVPYEDGSWRVDRMNWAANARGKGGYFQSLSTKLLQGIHYMRANPPTHWRPLPEPPARHLAQGDGDAK